MGGIFTCSADDSTCVSPIGSVTIKHCGCTKKVRDEEQKPPQYPDSVLTNKTPEQLAEIKARVDWAEIMWQHREEEKAEHKKDKLQRKSI